MNLLAPPSPIVPIRHQPASALARSWRGRNITLRSAMEIDAMRRAGAIVRAALEAARSSCVAGATTAEIDAAAHAEIVKSGGEALFLNYVTGRHDSPGRGGFPAATCVSVNEEVVHGIPGERVLADGDVVTVDCGVRLDGWCADAAITVLVGPAESTADRRAAAMIETADAILAEAIRLAAPGRRWSDIAERLELIALTAGFGVVEGYVGHGIGQALHEAPEVACTVVGDRHVGRDFTVRPGMTLAVEPIIALRPGPDGRTVATRVRDDGWTVVTADGVPACHVEHTIAITRDGAVVLTS